MKTLLVVRILGFALSFVPQIALQIHAEDKEGSDAIPKLVKGVTAEKNEMIIMWGGSFVTDIDFVFNNPAMFDQQVRSAAFALEEGKGYTPAMKALIVQPDLVDAVNRHIRELDPLSIGADKLAVVLGKIGDRDSVPALIDLYRRAMETTADPGAEDMRVATLNFRKSRIARNCTWALWELTGRKFAYPPGQWANWWKAVSPYFEVAELRDRRKLSHPDTPMVLDKLGKDAMAREQLVAIGRTASQELLERLKQADKDLQYEISWVADEMGVVEKLTPELRLDYYLRRFQGIEVLEDVRRRAFFQLDLAEFSSVAMAVERQSEMMGGQPSMWSFIKLNSNDFRAKYGTRPAWMNDRAWQQMKSNAANALIADLSRRSISKQINTAVPELVKGLNDESAAVCRCAIQLADMIGFAADENPEDLIIALRDAFLDEEDESNLGFGSALGRFESPVVNAAFAKGLFSKNLRIVRSSANEVDARRFPPEQFAKLYQRLEALTSHDNSRVRFASARSLVHAEPKRLVRHFDRLQNDEDPDVREQVCYAINKLQNPMHQDILVQLAMKEVRNQQDKNVRQTALNALADPAFESAIDDLLPLLDDPELYGFVLSTIVSAKGKKALPILMELLDQNRDPSDNVMQYLPRLTGKNFTTKGQWLDWWSKQ